jgi:flagellar biosynthesis protein FliR
MARILGLRRRGAGVRQQRRAAARIKLMVGLAITIGLAAGAAAARVPLDSWAGLLILFQQTLIGIAMGLTCGWCLPPST